MTDHAGPEADHGGPEADHRLPGRPRDPEVDGRILRAAVEVMSDVGLQNTTVSAVAERAGVARATIYLRWPTREALLGAMARAAGGGFPYTLTGDIEGDIRAGTEFARKIVAGAHFIDLMPELVAAVLAKPPQLSFDSVAANRKPFAAEYRATASEQGFTEDVDPHLAFDLLLGAQFVYILANGTPPPPRYTKHLADTIVAGLRAAQSSAPAGDESIPAD
jgi:AcrR family transcriptional regulator